ncbi:MAG: DUF3098 domain-containing protein [Bacteroidales bacterium]|jgi:uncharacterized membrane protein|nr:DUF3098 domain-containing protein [Bacteroidales bacterium]NLM92589.1 DUF3098 domain-containing protein [Bacteroidales bacterium]
MSKNKEEHAPLFDRTKYILMIVGLLVIALGFVLMIGGGSNDPNVFSYDLFSFRRITLAPMLVLLGFGIEFYAIMKRTTNEAETKATPGPKKAPAPAQTKASRR